VVDRAVVQEAMNRPSPADRCSALDGDWRCLTFEDDAPVAPADRIDECLREAAQASTRVNDAAINS